MGIRSRIAEGYEQNRRKGRNKFWSGVFSPFAGGYDSYADRYRAEDNARRKPHPWKVVDWGNRVKSGVAAAPAAAINIKDVATRRYAVMGFVFFAYFINFWWESKWFPGQAFTGLSMDFFKTQIIRGSWVGIYNIFHFNIYFMILAFAIFNLRNNKKPHILRVWLSLILVLYLLSSIPLLNTYMGLRNVIEAFLLLFTALYLSFFQTSKEEFISRVTVMWVLYNLYMFGVQYSWAGFMHLIFVLVFFITFGFGQVFKADRVQVNWWLLIIILFDFFLPEFLQRMYPAFPIASLPFLFFGTLLFAQVYQPNKITIFLIIIVVAFYFLKFSTLGGAFKDVIDQRIADQEDFEERRDMFSWSHWQELMSQWVNQSMYYGSGQDYYTSQVDKNAKEDLGVYFEHIQDNANRFYDNEKIVLDATIRAKNMVSDDGSFDNLTVSVSCFAKDKNDKKIYGEVYPREEYDIEVYDSEIVQCIFQPGQLAKGSYDVQFNAVFGFKTQAYLKRYFVLKQTLNALRRNQEIERDIEVLSINNIEDSYPTVQNSVAPIQIQASDRVEPIIKLDKEEKIQSLFKVRLNNDWKGTIKKINSLKFYLPKAIAMDSIRCNPFAMKPYLYENSPKYADYFPYGLAFTNNVRLRNIKESVEQECWIEILPSEIDELMQPSEVTTRYFLMEAQYDYQLEEILKINVKEPREFNAKITSSTDGPITTGSDVKCTVKDIDKLTKAKISLFADSVSLGSETVTCFENTCSKTFRNLNLVKGTILRCEAQRSDNDNNPETAFAYAEVKNALPKVESIVFDKTNKVSAGTPLICTVTVVDPDSTDVNVRFEVTGIESAPSQKPCPGKCSIEIPTDRVQETSDVRCTAIPFDEVGTGEEKFETAKVVVQ